VYFMRAGDLIKIGFSKDVERRRKTFQTAIGKPLEVVAVLESCPPSIERIFHRALSEKRKHGEWFASDSSLRFVIDRINAGDRPLTEAAIRALAELGNDAWEAYKREGIFPKRLESSHHKEQFRDELKRIDEAIAAGEDAREYFILRRRVCRLLGLPERPRHRF
jgi:hypothetical protein